MDFKVVTLGVGNFHYELAHNLALSCHVFGVPVYLLTDHKRGDPVFAGEAFVPLDSKTPEDIWRTKVYPLKGEVGGIEFNGRWAFVDADCLMLNEPSLIDRKIDECGFHMPAERIMPDELGFIYSGRIRDIACSYGIPNSALLPQCNGGFFCWDSAHPLSKAWYTEFERALKWSIDTHSVKREEAAMLLANAFLGVVDRSFSDTCYSMWITTNRSYGANGSACVCVDYLGVERRPVFGHYGSANTVNPPSDRTYQGDYRELVNRIKTRHYSGLHSDPNWVDYCLRGGIK